MPSVASATSSIIHEYPQFVIRSIEKVGEGWDNEAFDVNGEYIFRFPKNSTVKKNLRVEQLVLPVLQPRLALPIPQFCFFSRSQIFTGYRKLPGAFFSPAIFLSLALDQQKKILQQLAEVILSINRVPLGLLTHTGLTVKHYHLLYLQNLEAYREQLFPFFSQTQKVQIESIYRDYCNNPANFSYSPCLVHADISSDHLLYDPDSNRLSGLIDFGDIAIGDADYEFLYLQEEYGSNFIERLLQYYPHVNHLQLFDKLNFLRLADLLEFLQHHLKLGKMAEFKTHLPLLEHSLQGR